MGTDRSDYWAEGQGVALLTDMEAIGRLAEDPAIDVPGLVMVCDSAVALLDFDGDTMTAHNKEDAARLVRWAIRRLGAVVDAGNEAARDATERLATDASRLGLL